MSDFYEIDFLQVHTAKSGDAIAIRYQVGEAWWVHLVDGGYSSTAPDVAQFIQKTYGTNTINNVVVTHPDRDHAEGLAPILEHLTVETLWMLRPWTYAPALLLYFPCYQSVQSLAKRLQEEYPYIYELEKIALRRGIEIKEPFQGQRIGAFTVLAPSPARYFQLIIQSEKTPQQSSLTILGGLMQAAAKALRFVKAGWGSEKFSGEPTSVENEMSVVQFASLCGDSIVLTGDAGRDGMTEAANYAPQAGLALPGVSHFQVPHHGGRRNLSSDILDRWVGPRLPSPLPEGRELFHAIISAAKEDADHPRKAVKRALLHRGARLLTTEEVPITAYRNSTRPFTRLANTPYPDEQEED